MKPTILLSLLVMAFSTVAVQAQNFVTNGDFETGTGDAFWQTPPWWNAGKAFNQGTSARTREGAVIGGSYSATVNDRWSKTGDVYSASVLYSQKTTRTIAAGDVFTLSYDWYPVDDFWQKNRDTIRFFLFATANDKLNGPVVWSSELVSDFFQGSINTYKSVAQTTPVVNAEAVGKTLFIQFHGMDTVDGATGSIHFARVDNIVVKVLDTK
ncbi:MAG: hypothetical protein SFU85_00665 [Candidatus Methylacidiphilales bacterium]|nr:hypothetical protein [Candidatus Methylacidiphilales bacterium]